MGEIFGSFFGGLLFIGLVILAVLLFLAPLFIYQIKKTLESQLDETRELQRLIKQLIVATERQGRL